MKLEILSFRDRFGIMLEKRFGGMAGKDAESYMGITGENDRQ